MAASEFELSPPPPRSVAGGQDSASSGFRDRSATSSARRARLVTIWLVGALALCLPAWHVVTALLSDSYMTLYAGRWVAAHGIPHQEVFTLGAHGRPWVDQQWLAELMDYGAWTVGGYALLGLLNGLALGGAYAGLAALALRRLPSPAMAVACSAAALVTGLPGMFIRAQDLAVPLFVAALWLCLGDAEADRPRWRLGLLVPVLGLWANVHGSILLGAGLVVLYLLYRSAVMAFRGRRRPAVRYALLALAAALTPLLTPYGMHILSYYRDLIGNPGVAAGAPEDRPPSLAAVQSLLFFVPLAVTAAAMAVCWHRRHRLPGVLLTMTTLMAGATLFASRNVIWFGIADTLLLAASAEAWLPTARPSRSFVAALASLAALGTGLGFALLIDPPHGGYERDTPIAAISAAAAYTVAHPGTRILADNAASSALLWHFPELDGRVAYDARLERYSPAELRRWIGYQLAQGPEWPTDTDGYQVLLGSTVYNPGLVRRLRALARPLAYDGRGIAVLNPY